MRIGGTRRRGRIGDLEISALYDGLVLIDQSGMAPVRREFYGEGVSSLTYPGTYRLTHDVVSICMADGKKAVRIIHRGDKVSLTLAEHNDPRLMFVTWKGDLVLVFRRDFAERSARIDYPAGTKRLFGKSNSRNIDRAKTS